MNWDRIEGNWKQFKGRVKEQWGKLTDDDIDVIAGKRDQLVGKIQEQYGIGKDEAEKQVDRSATRSATRTCAQYQKPEDNEHLNTLMALFAAAGLCLAGGASAQTRNKDARDQAIKAAETQYKADKARATR